MADLEDLGYIFQPHTSAGRIPSDKGYRFYVDLLMENKEQEISKREDALLEKTDKVEHQLCDDGFRTGQQPEHIEVHSAITGG